MYTQIVVGVELDAERVMVRYQRFTGREEYFWLQSEFFVLTTKDDWNGENGSFDNYEKLENPFYW